MDELKHKRVRSLADKGFELLNQGEFEEALAISYELKEAKFSAAFDIGAQAQAGLGNIVEAIAILKEGLELAPQAWPNWQLLGNYFSDMGDFENAKDAFSRALQCKGVWKDSILLNQSILSNRISNFSEALNISSNINDDDLYLHRLEVEISAYTGLEKYEEALILANKVLSKKEHFENNELIGRIVAKVGEIHLKQGKPKQEVKSYLFEFLSFIPNNRSLFSLIRNIDNKYSDTAHYYRALIHCKVPKTSPDYKDIKGYFCRYDVIAESTNQLLEFINQFEAGVVDGGNYNIDEYEILDYNSKDPCGVYSRTGRVIYENES